MRPITHHCSEGKSRGAEIDASGRRSGSRAPSDEIRRRFVRPFAAAHAAREMARVRLLGVVALGLDPRPIGKADQDLAPSIESPRTVVGWPTGETPVEGRDNAMLHIAPRKYASRACLAVLASCTVETLASHSLIRPCVRAPARPRRPACGPGGGPAHEV